tara:strand:+ start:2929 stop:3150 length:222 start_codon:yes stop_codon:yes gene_type:complete
MEKRKLEESLREIAKRVRPLNLSNKLMSKSKGDASSEIALGITGIVSGVLLYPLIASSAGVVRYLDKVKEYVA